MAGLRRSEGLPAQPCDPPSRGGSCVHPCSFCRRIGLVTLDRVVTGGMSVRPNHWPHPIAPRSPGTRTIPSATFAATSPSATSVRLNAAKSRETVAMPSSGLPKIGGKMASHLGFISAASAASANRTRRTLAKLGPIRRIRLRSAKVTVRESADSLHCPLNGTGNLALIGTSIATVCVRRGASAMTSIRPRPGHRRPQQQQGGRPR